ncbi:hypothetical protein AZE42_10819, partial [Rhizopogon vesiculosus]
MLSHGNITHALLALTIYGMELGKVQAPPVWNTPEGIQVSFNVVPLYHALGLYFTNFFNFLSRSTTIVLPKWDIQVFFDSIPKYQITNLSLIPSLVHQIVHHSRFKTVDLSSVKAISCNAAHIAPQLAQQLRTRFPDVGKMDGAYGLSEVAAAVSIVPVPGMLNGRAKNKPGSVGIIFPGIEVRIPTVWNTPEGIQVSFNVVPLYHTLGLYFTNFSNFLSRSTTILLPKWDIEVFFDSIPKYQITNLSLVPSLVHQMIHHPRFKTVDLSFVKAISCSAAHLAPQLAQQLRAGFPDVGEIYGRFGLSEVAAPLSIVPVPGMLNGRAKNKPGSVGIIIPGVEVRIVRPDGSLAGPNEVGELFTRGAGSALGYKGNDKASRETFVDGWVRTGDRMRIDEDGVLFFEDRAKDTLKVSGMQVSPLEIETTLLAHPDKLIIDVTVAGVTGGRTADERITRAWVVFSPTGAALGSKEV